MNRQNRQIRPTASAAQKPEAVGRREVALAFYQEHFDFAAIRRAVPESGESEARVAVQKQVAGDKAEGPHDPLDPLSHRSFLVSDDTASKRSYAPVLLSTGLLLMAFGVLGATVVEVFGGSAERQRLSAIVTDVTPAPAPGVLVMRPGIASVTAVPAEVTSAVPTPVSVMTEAPALAGSSGPSRHALPSRLDRAAPPAEPPAVLTAAAQDDIVLASIGPWPGDDPAQVSMSIDDDLSYLLPAAAGPAEPPFAAAHAPAYPAALPDVRPEPALLASPPLPTIQPARISGPAPVSVQAVAPGPEPGPEPELAMALPPRTVPTAAPDIAVTPLVRPVRTAPAAGKPAPAVEKALPPVEKPAPAGEQYSAAFGQTATAARQPAPAAGQPAPARIVIHYNAGGEPDARRAAGLLRQQGFSGVELRAVGFGISRTNTRYFHQSDRGLSAGVARALWGGVPSRDFTHFSPAPRRGTVEVWIAGG